LFSELFALGHNAEATAEDLLGHDGDGHCPGVEL
jgi:hypothetical protein